MAGYGFVICNELLIVGGTNESTKAQGTKKKPQLPSHSFGYDNETEPNAYGAPATGRLEQQGGARPSPTGGASISAVGTKTASALQGKHVAVGGGAEGAGVAASASSWAHARAALVLRMEAVSTALRWVAGTKTIQVRVNPPPTPLLQWSCVGRVEEMYTSYLGMFEEKKRAAAS